jgi:nucleoside phosphorylase
MDDSSTLTHQDYTVGWTCALPIEMAAAVGMLDRQHHPLQQDPNDHNTYTLGCIGAHNVVIACLPTGVTGTISAARVANQMLSSFQQLRFGLMVGIGGGVPSQDNDIRLGDVVVSKPTGIFGGVVQYDFGKTVQDGRFERTGFLNRPPNVLLSAVSSLHARDIREGHKLSEHLLEMSRRYPKMGPQFTYPGAQHDSLYEAEYNHERGSATCSKCDSGRLVNREPRSLENPVIHYGLIASGDQLSETQWPTNSTTKSLTNSPSVRPKVIGLAEATETPLRGLGSPRTHARLLGALPESPLSPRPVTILGCLGWGSVSSGGKLR